MNVQFVRIDGTKAWFAGQVTSTTSLAGSACCNVGDWIFYEVWD